MVIYGYEHDVLLITEIVPPKGFTGDADISADVDWLACQEECVPGRSIASLRIATGDPQPTPEAPIFKKWRSRHPKFTAEDWSWQVDHEGDILALVAETRDEGAQPTGAEFFPREAGVLDHAALQGFQRTSRGFRLSLTRDRMRPTPVDRVAGVIVLKYPDADRAYTLDISIQ